jgi:shikimate kinase
MNSDRLRIALVGFMGCGKSAVGVRLSKILKLPWLDSDALIEKASGMDTPTFFSTMGEKAFRERESQCLLATSKGPSCVLSCGGGMVLAQENRDLLRDEFFTIWLKVLPETVLKRIDRGSRPLLDCPDPLSRARSLLDSRLPLYAEVSHFSVDTERMNPDQLAEFISESIPSFI